MCQSLWWGVSIEQMRDFLRPEGDRLYGARAAAMVAVKGYAAQ